MTTSSIKKSVIDTYSKLAKSTHKGIKAKLFGCCDPPNHAHVIAEKIGYSHAELTTVPEGSNLGVGCGNPSALAHIQSGETVVDLGSGAGFDAFLVAPIVGETGTVIGVDLSDEMLKLARRNASQGSYTQVQFVKGDIEALPLEEGCADHVISNCVINLSFHKAKVYREAYRVLKKGGRLAISDIVLERELPAFIQNSLAGHVACVSGAEKLETYLQYVANAGFTDIQVEKKTPFPLELMLADPQIQQLAQEMGYDIHSDEARDLASRVVSISLSARK